MILYLVRHGQVENPKDLVYGRLPGFPLSLEGRFQVEKLARELSSEKVEAIYSSPLLRTKQTSEILSRHFGVPVFLDERLTEIDLGNFVGWTWPEYFGAIRGVDCIKKITGREDVLDSGLRVMSVIKEIKQKEVYRRIALVSHEAPLVGVRLNLAGRAEKDYDEFKIGVGTCVKMEY